MKYLLLISMLALPFSPAVAEDPVDELDRKFKRLAYEGLLKLHVRHLVDLEEVKRTAMSNADLTAATRAADAIKALQIEVLDLEKKRDALEEGGGSLPENQFYKMTYASGKTGTEKGAKIFCNFARLPLTDFAGEKLALVISAGEGKDSETSHEIFVFDATSGKEIGKTSALGRGKTKKITLVLPPSEILKLAIAVKGGDALHLKQIEKGIPELYLEIEK